MTSYEIVSKTNFLYKDHQKIRKSGTGSSIFIYLSEKRIHLERMRLVKKNLTKAIFVLFLT